MSGAVISTMTTPSSTRIGKVVIQAGIEARTAMPVSRSNRQPCSGHTTTVPETMPSHSGPPWCGHALSMATKRSPRLKMAISTPIRLEPTGLRAAGCSLSCVIRVQLRSDIALRTTFSMG